MHCTQLYREVMTHPKYLMYFVSNVVRRAQRAMINNGCWTFSTSPPEAINHCNSLQLHIQVKLLLTLTVSFHSSAQAVDPEGSYTNPEPKSQVSLLVSKRSLCCSIRLNRASMDLLQLASPHQVLFTLNFCLD